MANHLGYLCRCGGLILLGGEQLFDTNAEQRWHCQRCNAVFLPTADLICSESGTSDDHVNAREGDTATPKIMSAKAEDVPKGVPEDVDFGGASHDRDRDV